MRTDHRHGDQQAADDIAEQDGDEGAHLDHAVAAGEFAFAQVLRQVGKLHRPEERGVQAEQEHAGQERGHALRVEANRRQQHDADLERT